MGAASQDKFFADFFKKKAKEMKHQEQFFGRVAEMKEQRDSVKPGELKKCVHKKLLTKLDDKVNLEKMGTKLDFDDEREVEGVLLVGIGLVFYPRILGDSLAFLSRRILTATAAEKECLRQVEDKVIQRMRAKSQVTLPQKEGEGG